MFVTCYFCMSSYLEEVKKALYFVIFITSVKSIKEYCVFFFYMVHKSHPAFLRISKNQCNLTGFVTAIFVCLLRCGRLNYFSPGTGGALYHQDEPGNRYNLSSARKCLSVLSVLSGRNRG